MSDDAMMRLPEPMTVAELKQYIDRRFLTKQEFKRELKRELRRFATRDDLKGFASRADLERELKRHATKDELRALREDLNDFRREMRASFVDLKSELMSILHNHEYRIMDLEAEARRPPIGQ